MDFGELKHDKNFVENITNLSNCIKEIDKQVTECVEFQDYEKFTAEEKVKFDLYLTYTLNSLYWMYVKLQGIDPNEHGIKNEISRVRQAMLRDKQIYENKTLRPTIDKAAAGRFIKHGIHYREKKHESDKNIDQHNQIQNQDENMEIQNSNSSEMTQDNDATIQNNNEEPGKFVRVRKKRDESISNDSQDESQSINENDTENSDISVNNSNENEPTTKKIKTNKQEDGIIEISDNEPVTKKSKTNKQEDGIIEISDNESDLKIKKKKKKKRKNIRD